METLLHKPMRHAEATMVSTHFFDISEINVTFPEKPTT